MDIKKRNKKGKVGVLNDNFEMEEASNSVKKKVRPFLNNIKDAQAKNNNAKSNILEDLVGAKLHISKWKDFVNRRRVRKKNGTLTGVREDEKKVTGGLGLDDIHDDFVSGDQKIFGKSSSMHGMSSASNRALLQYFAKLGRSTQDNEEVDLDFIETLLKNGANVNCTDKHGQTLMHEVASRWHTDVAKFLCDFGADVNKSDNYGRTPLHVAAADDYPDMIALLIEQGADKEAKTSGEQQTAVHYAARNDAAQGLKMLVKLNCDYKNVMDFKGRTPLHVAAELDRSETARLLLELEAPAGVSDIHGQAAITWMISKMPPVAAEAVEQFHVKDRPNRKQHFYLHLLVQNRAKDPKFFTQSPLQVAVKYKQFDILTHPVFTTLLDKMWDKFGWWRAYGSILFNFIYILLWTVYGVSVEYDQRHLYTLPADTWRIVLLFAAIAITIWQIVDEIREYKRSLVSLSNWKSWRSNEIEEDMKYCHPRWPEEKVFLEQEKENLEESNARYFSDPWNIFDWLCYLQLTVVIATHIADIVAHNNNLARVHIRLTAIVIIFLWLRLMKNVRAFAFLGPFVVMLGAMVTDVIKFLFLYLEFYIPYVCAFWMIFGGNKIAENAPPGNGTEIVTVDGFTDFNKALFTLFRMTLVDEYAYDEMKAVDSVMTDILVGTWLALSAVLCLNLFIALLSDTFQRVYDNAKANNVMQKAILMLYFWDGMSSDARNKFLDHVDLNCAPFSEYYDDDMTEDDGSDLKKVTIQIKEELDDLKEKWHDQFGYDEGQSALEELREEESPRTGLTDRGGKMVTAQKFQAEIDGLRDEVRLGLIELQKEQTVMMNKFKQDMKVVKSLLLDLSGQGNGGQGGHGGHGSGPGSQMGAGGDMTMVAPMEPNNLYTGYYHQQGDGGMTAMESSSSRPKSAGRRKKKKKPLDADTMSPGDIMQRQTQGVFAQIPFAGQPVVEVLNQDFLPDDPYFTDVLTVTNISPHVPAHSDA